MRITRRHWIAAPAAIDFLALNDARLTTVGTYLAALGADPELIRRYAGQVGIRMVKAMRATGQRPGKVLVLIKHRCRAGFRKAQNAYSPALLPLLASVVRDYTRTAHLLLAAQEFTVTTFKPGQHVVVADGTTHVVKSLLQVGTEPLRVVVEGGAAWLASECEHITDPEVAACRIIHATAPVAHCADCGICEDCDVTLGEQETPNHELCETCANAADELRGLALLATAYSTDHT